MVMRSFLVCLMTSSVAFAADSDGDGCQDAFETNSACVDVDATVDGSSTVGANSLVFDGATVGPQIAIGANVVVGARSTLAGRVAHTSNPLPIGSGTVIGRSAQLAADHVLGTDVTIARSVVAGERLTVAAGGTLGYAAQVGTDVTVGAGAVVGNLVDLGDFSTIGDNAVVARGVQVSDGASSGDGVSIGGVVGPEVTLGAGSRVEAGARVRKDAAIGASAAVEDGGRVGRGADIGAGATVFGRVGADAIVGPGSTVEAGSRVARGGEVCTGATLPSGSVVRSEGTWPEEGCSSIVTCQTIKASSPSSVDGVYTVDPDGVGGVAAFDAYCEMDSVAGGWTQVLRMNQTQSLNLNGAGRDNFWSQGGNLSVGGWTYSSFTSLTETEEGFVGLDRLQAFGGELEIRVVGVNQNGVAVDEVIAMQSVAFDTSNSLVETGPIQGGGTWTAAVTGDTNTRSNWGVCGVNAANNVHVGLGLCTNGLSTSIPSNTQVQIWHYGDYNQCMNVSFGEPGSSANYTYSCNRGPASIQLYVREQ